MLEEIEAYDARTKLPEILRRVEAGESFTIANRGRPIADVVPSRAGSRLKAQAAISNILNARKYTVSDDTLADMKEAGRK